MAACLLAAIGCKDVARRVLEHFASAERPVELPKLTAPEPTQTAAFAQAMQVAATMGDVEGMSKLIDWDGVLARGTAGLNISETNSHETKRGMIEAAKSRGILFMMAEAGKASNVRYLEAASQNASRNGETWVVLRVLQAGGGMEHCSFLLDRKPDGRALAVDWNMMSIGENLTAILRRSLMPLGTSVSAIAARLGGEEGMTLRYSKPLIEMQKLASEKKALEALAVYEKLPAEAKNLKLFLIARITAAQQLGPQEHAAALDALIAAHPEDPTAAVFAIDAYTYRGDHKKVVAAIDALSAHAGPDPYFDVLRAGPLITMNDFDGAHAAALRALEAEPDLTPARWTLVTIATKRKDFPDLARWIGELAAQKKIDPRRLGNVPELADFVKSPEYEKLLASATPPAPTP
ncbi:MAG TPA: hypothetical protein VHM19_18665 [Polyangiales bacterium]|nr:hypothetical protein [Polyangiales bacterium]